MMGISPVRPNGMTGRIPDIPPGMMGDMMMEYIRTLVYHVLSFILLSLINCDNLSIRSSIEQDIQFALPS
jgi:hypothetical protein